MTRRKYFPGKIRALIKTALLVTTSSGKEVETDKRKSPPGAA